MTWTSEYIEYAKVNLGSYRFSMAFGYAVGFLAGVISNGLGFADFVFPAVGVAIATAGLLYFDWKKQR